MRVLAASMIVALLCCSYSPARANGAAPVSVADRQAIEHVITSQLDAFHQDAGDAAFGFASPNIQAMFGDAPRFMAMVREAYPPVYRWRSFTFGQLTTTSERVVQNVMLVGPDGAAALALYTMERQQDGTWRIDGCALTKPNGLSI